MKTTSTRMRYRVTWRLIRVQTVWHKHSQHFYKTFKRMYEVENWSRQEFAHPQMFIDQAGKGSRFILPSDQFAGQCSIMVSIHMCIFYAVTQHYSNKPTNYQHVNLTEIGRSVSVERPLTVRKIVDSIPNRDIIKVVKRSYQYSSLAYARH